ncbi:DUF1963 domain-containing protein [Pseudoflavonifractor sp. 60]|uniref:YwqG family protein n=1 Tax=Pseudoflavonifractor sp. 60 TaxID=2304576 RepID=UPI0013708246|nr:DUF1963 domain-containing protein [Pseudoflavonifractor sp. 60]
MTNFELTKQICEEIRTEYRVPCLPFALEKGETGITDSKADGVPYLPKDQPWPRDAKGTPLLFLAQINCTQLVPLPDFPHTGLLQFFVGADDLWGMDFDNMTNTGGFRVLYWETVDPSVTEADVAAKRPPVPQEYGSPVFQPCRILFGAPVQQGMTPGDFHFDILFVQKWNQKKPDQPIEKSWDIFELLDEEDDADALFAYHDEDDEDNPFHQLGGFPYFTQNDPREEDYSEMDVLLFQLDSDSSDRKDLVLWGDCGVGNFFISREALKRRDFSRVLYNWDCC